MLGKKRRGGMLCVITRSALLDVAAGLEVLHVIDAATEIRRPRVNRLDVNVKDILNAVRRVAGTRLRYKRKGRRLVQRPVWKSKFYGAFVLNHRVVLHAIDATPARWRGDAGSSPLDRARTAASSPRNDLVKNCRVHPTHWLISTQTATGGAAADYPPTRR
jgi:hypothetical protein